MVFGEYYSRRAGHYCPLEDFSKRGRSVWIGFLRRSSPFSERYIGDYQLWTNEFHFAVDAAVILADETASTVWNLACIRHLRQAPCCSDAALCRVTTALECAGEHCGYTDGD